MDERKNQLNFWYFVVAIGLILALQQVWSQAQQVETVPYSRFLQYVEQGQVERVSVGEEHIRGELRAPLPDGRSQIYTVRVDPGVAEELRRYGVEVTGERESRVVQMILSWLIPIALFFGIWFYLFRRIAERGGGLGGMMSIGKSKAKVYVEKETGVTFEDVAGLDEAKAELAEIIEFLKTPERFSRLGARIPKGIMLVGPPGTGKTLMARAVAGEASVPFFSISGSEFVEMFVGVGAARVRDLFEQARKQAPCIIFIDELDSLGRARNAGPQMGGESEHEQTLNQLLAELDGFDPSSGVVLLAATNRPEALDPALMRPGRFDRQVLIDRPDRIGRTAILKVHARKVVLGRTADLERVAELTAGFTGADLANLVNEAAVVATRREGEAVELADFVAAIERIVAGLEKRNRLINERERKVVAYHEMGHALVSIALPGIDRVQKVSIIPRGIGSLGYTIQRPTEDRYLMTRDELIDKMTVLLAGRAAELVTFGELSTGASDDLMRVTDIARAMVARYGMDPGLGHVTYTREQSTFLRGPASNPFAVREYSEETAHAIDEAVRALVDRAMTRALAILEANRETLDRYAELLLERETLAEEDLTGIEMAPAAEHDDGR